VRVGAYPGTFDPPTVAHLAIAEAALVQGRLDRLDLVVSQDPLGKHPGTPTLPDRLAVLESVAATRAWLEVRLTSLRLIADIASGYDVIVVGADKWLQVVDTSWYESAAHRDDALDALPEVLVVPRPPHDLPLLPPLGPGPPRGVSVLVVDPVHEQVSSSAVRSGRREWMAPEAAAFDRATGAWSDPDRYRRSIRRG
jgi:nicotinate-nucleotide adenylyltransferase